MAIKIEKPLRSQRFIARSIDDSIFHTGITNSNQETITGLPVLEGFEDENEFLSEAAGWANNFPDLPGAGEQVDQGQYYKHGSAVVIARQSHIRTNHEPSDIPALFMVARAPGTSIEWVENEQVGIGTVREYNGNQYKAIQAHVTLEGWEPPNVPALWVEIVEAPQDGVWVEGIEVQVDDEYRYPDSEGTLYKVLQAHTTQAGWEPPNVPALWITVPEEPAGNVWEPGLSVTVGEEYWYPDEQGTLYVVIQSHTTLVGWEPPNVPALWGEV